MHPQEKKGARGFHSILSDFGFVEDSLESYHVATEEARDLGHLVQGGAALGDQVYHVRAEGSRSILLQVSGGQVQGSSQSVQ